MGGGGEDRQDKEPTEANPGVILGQVPALDLPLGELWDRSYASDSAPTLSEDLGFHTGHQPVINQGPPLKKHRNF